MKKSKRKVEFGDFQTPLELAREVCSLLRDRGIRPRSLVEPTCGSGSFLIAALETFPGLKEAIGLEIDPDHVERARSSIRDLRSEAKTRIIEGDFFRFDWPGLLEGLREPILVIGNPPWVTNSELGALRGSNLPPKTNFQRLRGLDALTGKSNFDISEWILLRIFEALDGRRGTVAVLCKCSVARKVLSHAWRNDFAIEGARIHLVDARKHFGASVDASLLVCDFHPGRRTKECRVLSGLRSREERGRIGLRSGDLVADLEAYQRCKDFRLRGEGSHDWRSGIKHDCSRVMELRSAGKGFKDQGDETVDIEGDYLFPLLKSSDLAGRNAHPRRWMLVTQKYIGEETRSIGDRSPKTWRYLNSKAHLLDARASSIYRNRPRFSIFGVGEYSFSPWKVAVSCFYKKPEFVAIGSHGGKPIVLDDTCCFLPCRSGDEARRIARVLNSDVARDFFEAFVFWDAKRPITAGVLDRLDREKLSRHLRDVRSIRRRLTPPSRPRTPRPRAPRSR